MKKLSSILLAMMICGSAYAQKVEINLGGGIVSNTAPPMERTWDSYRGGGMSPTVSFSVLGNVHKHWQVGGSLSIVPLTYETNTYYPLVFEDHSNQLFAPQTQDYYKSYIANPAISMQAVVNYRMRTGQFVFHTGMSAGYYFNPGYHGFYTADYREPVRNNGAVAGIQMGGTWQFCKPFGVTMQMGMSYYEPYRVIAFPATAGLKVCL
jgi:hypothetical protein